MKRLLTLAIILAFPTASWAQEPPLKLKRILYIGDSLSVGGFGPALEQGMSALPNTQVARYASCGSAVGHWFSGAVTVCGLRESFPTPHGRQQISIDPRRCPKETPQCGPNGGSWVVPPQKTPIFSELKILGHEPDLVVIELGTNSFDASRAGLEAETRRMIAAAKKKTTQCIWIGPPDIQECRVSGGRVVSREAIDRIYAAIATVTAEPASSCTVVDSRKYAKFHPGARDCLHVYTNTPSIAKAWAEGVMTEIQPIITQPVDY